MSDLMIMALALIWVGGFLMGYGLRGMLASRELIECK